MLLLFMNQRQKEVQDAVQYAGRGLSMTFHGSRRDFSGPESEGLQVCKCASVQVCKCARGDAESALDAAPSM